MSPLRPVDIAVGAVDLVGTIKPLWTGAAIRALVRPKKGAPTRIARWKNKHPTLVS